MKRFPSKLLSERERGGQDPKRVPRQPRIAGISVFTTLQHQNRRGCGWRSVHPTVAVHDQWHLSLDPLLMRRIAGDYAKVKSILWDDY